MAEGLFVPVHVVPARPRRALHAAAVLAAAAMGVVAVVRSKKSPHTHTCPNTLQLLF